MKLEIPFFNARRGAEANPLLSDDRGLLTQGAGGAYAHASDQGQLFTSAMAAAGAVLPIFSGTTQQFGIFNPAGSGKVADIVEIAMTYVDTTGAAGGYVLAAVKDAGADKATGGNLTSYTALDIWSGRTNGKPTDRSKMKVLTAFGVTAPVIMRHLGANQLVLTAADATTAAFERRYRFDGDLQVEPGTVICLAGNIATLSKWACSITWREKDA